MRTQRARTAGLAVCMLGLATVLMAGCPGVTGTNLLSSVTGGTDVSGGFNLTPTAVATANVTAGIVPLTVQFSSVDSLDDGLIVSREWNFGDGETSSEISPTHTFTETGEFLVTLTIVDDGDPPASATAQILISVTQAPQALFRITNPVTGEETQIADSSPATFRFDATESFDPDGEVVGYAWSFGDGRSDTEVTVDHTYDQAGTYRVELAVTDNTGVRGTKVVNVQVGIAKPTLRFSSPPSTQQRIVVPQDAPLWASVDFEVDSTASYFISAGLARDLDQCTAQSVVYDLTSPPQLTFRLEGHTDLVNDVGFRPRGADEIVNAPTEVLSASDDLSLRLYDAQNGDFVLDYSGNDAAPNCVAWGPDGGRFAFGMADGGLILASTAGAVVQSYAGHGDAVRDVVFISTAAPAAGAEDRPDDAVVSVGDDGMALAWSLGGGLLFGLTPDGAAAAHPGGALAVDYADGMIATGGADGLLRIWNAWDGGALITGDEHLPADATGQPIRAVAFADDGSLLATCGDNGYAVVWSVGGDGSDRTLTAELELEHPEAVTAAAFSPTDATRLVTGCADGVLRVWDVTSAETASSPVHTLEPCSSPITGLDISDDGMQLVASVSSGNDLPLDLVDMAANDIELSTPQQLDVSDIPPGSYYLWAEIDTDDTEPTRTYAAASDGDVGVIVTEVIAPMPSTIDGATVPEVTLSEYTKDGRRHREATVLSAPTTRRQIVDIGPLEAGDFVRMEFVSTPGYDSYIDEIEVDNQILLGGGFFFWFSVLFGLDDEADFTTGNIDATLGSEIDGVYSAMLLDEDQRVHRWYRSGADPLERDELILVTEDSAHNYLVLDSASSARIIVDSPANENERDDRLAVPSRQQQVFLDFRGGTTSLVSDPDDPFSDFEVPEFDASDVRSAYSSSDTQLFKDAIQQRVAALLQPYNIVVTSSEDPEADWPSEPYIKILFGGTIQLSEDTNACGDLYDYAAGVVQNTNPRNPRNLGISATGLVAIGGLDQRINQSDPDDGCVTPGLLPAQDMAAALGNATVHIVGMVLGLDQTIDASNDIMNPDALWSLATTNDLQFMTGAPRGQLNEPAIGGQDAPALLLEWFGPSED